MNLPTTTPNDRDLAWYVRECEALQCINAALKKQANDEFDAVITRNMELERENAALREDKERLEWLLTGDGGFWVNWMYEKDEWTPELKASRDAIDACRNWRIGNGRQP